MSGNMDPFAGMALEMRSQARHILPPRWRLGRVTAVGEGTLRIQAGGLELDEEDLWVDPRLLAGHEAPFQVKLTIPEPQAGEAGDEATLDVGGTRVQTFFQVAGTTISSIPLYELPGIFSGVIRGTVELLSDRLQVGDWVALLPDENEEIYYILTKVVRPGDVVSPD